MNYLLIIVLKVTSSAGVTLIRHIYIYDSHKQKQKELIASLLLSNNYDDIEV